MGPASSWDAAPPTTAYTNMKWGHAQNYHLTLDSGVLGILIKFQSGC